MYFCCLPLKESGLGTANAGLETGGGRRACPAHGLLQEADTAWPCNTQIASYSSRFSGRRRKPTALWILSKAKLFSHLPLQFNNLFFIYLLAEFAKKKFSKMSLDLVEKLKENRSRSQ